MGGIEESIVENCGCVINSVGKTRGLPVEKVKEMGD